MSQENIAKGEEKQTSQVYWGRILIISLIVTRLILPYWTPFPVYINVSKTNLVKFPMYSRTFHLKAHIKFESMFGDMYLPVNQMGGHCKYEFNHTTGALQAIYWPGKWTDFTFLRHANSSIVTVHLSDFKSLGGVSNCTIQATFKKAENSDKLQEYYVRGGDYPCNEEPNFTTLVIEKLHFKP